MQTFVFCLISTIQTGDYGKMNFLQGKETIMHGHYRHNTIIIIIISNLSNDRFKASSKTIPPPSAI